MLTGRHSTKRTTSLPVLLVATWAAARAGRSPHLYVVTLLESPETLSQGYPWCGCCLHGDAVEGDGRTGQDRKNKELTSFSVSNETHLHSDITEHFFGGRDPDSIKGKT